MANQEYDLLVIGAGAAGSSAVTSIDAKQMRVGLVERSRLGGTCLNYGCDPTKSFLHIAKLLYDAQHAEQFGLDIPTVKDDWGKVLAYVHNVIHRLRGGSPEEAREDLVRKDIDVMQGEATFVSPHEVSIASNTVSAKRILIATGSETLVPPVEGLEEAGYITNIQAVSLPILPRRMAIVGGGAIGIEFAQMFRRFGVEITVLERDPNILDKEDRELAEKLCQLLTDQGIRLEASAELQRVQSDGQCKRLIVRCGEREEEELVVDEILMAVGRRASFESLHLEKAGVKTSKKGVIVDATLRTNVPHIWAAGDVATPYQFTHVASEQGMLAAHNAFAAEPQPFDDRAIPWVTFTSPALAHVGKTEDELRQDGVEYRVARVPFSENERSLIEDTPEGLVKLLVDQKGIILGGHILGARADDLLAPIVLAMRAGVPAEALASTILPYPTRSEALRQAARQL
jgi:pyruvate/2-oxoglutarate dehydrogenase complex dihydrolipoamide dehydrogenase (E3) component